MPIFKQQLRDEGDLERSCNIVLHFFPENPRIRLREEVAEWALLRVRRRSLTRHRARLRQNHGPENREHELEEELEDEG